MHTLIAAPITTALIYRSYSHSSLTIPGILVAGLTALIHALHPSPIPFTLLVTFFLLGTTATKVKKDVKSSLTLSSTGHRTFGTSGRIEDWLGSGWNKHKPPEQVNPAQSQNDKKQQQKQITGGQEPRSATQVLANSFWSSLLCLVHVSIYGLTDTDTTCFSARPGRDLLLAGVIANYASVTADTLSSELGILSPVRPRFILTLREVPPGTNGGITGTGLLSGLGGALVIGLMSVLLLPDLWIWDVCSAGKESAEHAAELLGIVLFTGAWGALGSVLDSVLGACLQASVVDRRSGKVVEAHNGGRVLVSSGASGKQKEKVDGEVEVKGSRILGSGRDILDNNQVNFLMAGTMTVGAVLLVGRAWGLDVGRTLSGR